MRKNVKNNAKDRDLNTRVETLNDWVTWAIARDEELAQALYQAQMRASVLALLEGVLALLEGEVKIIPFDELKD